MKIRMLAWIAAVAVAMGISAPESAQAQLRNLRQSRSGHVASLRDQLEKGLRARLPGEFKYIDAVIREVDKGRLSRKVVLSTFDYSRNRNLRRPFPYFERALSMQAVRLGVILPPVYR